MILFVPDDDDPAFAPRTFFGLVTAPAPAVCMYQDIRSFLTDCGRWPPDEEPPPESS
jgi:hypothetical protein